MLAVSCTWLATACCTADGLVDSLMPNVGQRGSTPRGACHLRTSHQPADDARSCACLRATTFPTGQADTPKPGPEPASQPAGTQDHVPRPCQKQPTTTDNHEHSGDIRTTPELQTRSSEHGGRQPDKDE